MSRIWYRFRGFPARRRVNEVSTYLVFGWQEVVPATSVHEPVNLLPWQDRMVTTSLPPAFTSSWQTGPPRQALSMTSCNCSSYHRPACSDLSFALLRRAAGPAGTLARSRLRSCRALTAGGPLLRSAAEAVGLRHKQGGGATRVLARPPAAAVRHHHSVVLLADGDAHLRVEEAVEDGDEDSLRGVKRVEWNNKHR